MSDVWIEEPAVYSGSTATATLMLSQPAPTGGVVVNLTGSRAGIATVPATVTVPAGESFASFSIPTEQLSYDRGVIVTSSYNNIARTTILHIRNSPELRGLNPSVRREPSPLHLADVSQSMTSSSAPLSPSTEATGDLTRRYFYTPELNLLAETEFSAGTSTTFAHQYVWFAGQPIAQISGYTTNYYFNDHLGTPLLQTDASQTIVWRAEYEPYGTPHELRTGLGKHQPIRFPGQENDGASDLSYNVFRWYRSEWGRYTQADPIGLAGGMNLYAYVEGNPLNLTDPTGPQTRSDRWDRDKTPQQIEEEKQRSCARKSFWDAYDDMKEANWKKSDKYFHCRANCDATRCGPFGENEACDFSDFREWFDQKFKGDTPAQSAADQAANRFGRAGAKKQPNASCQTVCGPYRPKGLPSQY